MYSTHFLYCLITLIVEDLSAYAYFFIEKKGSLSNVGVPHN